jgi:hypothetical protein
MSVIETVNPVALIEQINRDARRLDSGGRRLASAIKELSELETDYRKHVEEARIRIYHDSKESGERMPAEDIRDALAHRQIPSDVYAKFLTARAEVDALKAWTRTVEHAVSARQSLLAALREELRTAT